MAGSRARSRTLRSVAGEPEDARETREMLEAILQASWSVHSQHGELATRGRRTSRIRQRAGSAAAEQKLAEQR
eukprot:356718-Prymnesium_polylepis.1